MSNTISILNDLIETSKDGEKGFRTSAEDTRNGELKTVFVARAQDCAKAAADLQKLVTQLGGNPESGGSVAGAVHRGWVNLKSSVTERSDLAISSSMYASNFSRSLARKVMSPSHSTIKWAASSASASWKQR